jgi:hypothetical protein
LKKIYIHHRYSDYLFKLFGHHSYVIEKNINGDGEGNIIFNYKENLWEFVFDKKIHYKDDGYHLLDLYQIYMSIGRGNDSKFNDLKFTDVFYDNIYKIICRMEDISSEGSKWILTFFLGEKLFFDDITSINPIYDKLTKKMHKLTKHKLFTDNIPYNTRIKNHIFPLSSVVMFWYFRTKLLLYKEYGNLHKIIPHTHLWGYHIKRHKYRRLEIGRLLDKSKVFVSQTDWNDVLVPDFKNLFEKSNITPIDGAYYNNLVGDNDFDNKFNGYIEADKIGFDLFFSLLPKGKGVIIDETWGESNNFKIQYLSEKTYGMILAKIPFITTSLYPLDLIKFAIGGEYHPYYDKIKSLETDTQKLVEWINSLEDVDIQRCQSWVNDIHDLLYSSIYQTNHFLENINNKVETNLI